MPFSTRVVPSRQPIPDLYGNAAQNILEKNAVSDMVGLLQQLNVVSKYASEVFGDIFADTEKHHQRIAKVTDRLRNIEQRVPKQEQLFVDNSPMFFYDNPYMGSEFQRKDPNQGLLFRRDRCTNEVNRRRAAAGPIPDFSSLDRFSTDGQPNAVKYSDSRFFINEWLAAEEIKIKEEKKRRKQMREEKRARKGNSDKGKLQRQPTRILAVKKKVFDANTGQVIVTQDTEEEQYAKTTDYQLSDNSSVTTSAARVSTKIAAHASSPPMKNNQAGPPPPAAAAALSHQQAQAQAPPIAAIQVNGGPPPAHGLGGGGAGGAAPPPAPIAAMQAPPMAYGGGGGGDNSSAPMGNMNGGGPPPVPMQSMPMGMGMGGGPPPPPGGGNMMGVPQSHMRSMPSYGVPEDAGPQIDRIDSGASDRLAPARPAFMQQLVGDNVQARLKATPKVERQIPMDSRSAMLSQLQGKKAKTKLKRVDTEAIAAQKAADKTDESTLVAELMKRRAWIEDEEDDDGTDSDWDDD